MDQAAEYGVDSYVNSYVNAGVHTGPVQPVHPKKYVTGPDEVATVDWPAEALAKGAASGSWVQNLSITTTTTCPALQGRIYVDLNRGAGGKYIYLCYGKDEGIADPRGPIKNLSVSASYPTAPEGMSTEGCAAWNPDDGACYSWWIKAVNGSNGDLNQGAGGWYVTIRKRYTNIYPDIHQGRGNGEYWPSQHRLANLAISYGGSGAPCPTGYLRDLMDLNYGVGGSYIYLCQKFEPFAY